jgi:deoxyribose-phosphate aldolase
MPFAMTMIASYIDHTILKPTAITQDIEQLCTEALVYQFAAVCVPPQFVKIAKQFLANSSVRVATVIGFPFGYNTIDAKVVEIKQAIVDGADELDIVHNIAAVKEGKYELLSQEIAKCLQPVRLHNKCLKVIIESGVLTDDEIVKSCQIYAQHKVDFVKTSTGYAAIGATLNAVQIMRDILPEDIAIKASGGIRDYDFAQQLVAAGASRLGVSAGVKIIEEEKLIHSK